MDTVSDMYRNRPSAANANAKPSNDYKIKNYFNTGYLKSNSSFLTWSICVPWCCSNNSVAMVLGDLFRAEDPKV